MARYTPAFLRVALRPRMTMRWVLEDDPNFGVMIISLVAGITAILRTSLLHGMHPLPGLMGLHPQLDSIIAYGIGATPEWPLLIATVGIAGGLLGLMGVYLGALLLWPVGLILGGSGRYADVRSALAWSFVPYSWLLPLWIMVTILEGPELRLTGFNYLTMLPGADSALIIWILVICDYTLRVLGLVWLVLRLSVAHRFTLLKAVINTGVIVALLLYLVPRFHSLGF